MNYFLFYVIVAGIGLASIIVALIFNLMYRKLATVVPGTIVGFADNRSRQFPIIQIQDDTGTKEIRCKYGFRSSRYQIGQQVNVYYKPGHVKNAIIKGDHSDIWALLVVAGLFVVIGVMQYIRFKLIIY